MSKRTHTIAFVTFLLIVLVHIPVAYSQLQPISDQELSNIRGQVGIDTWIKDITIDSTIQHYRYTDTDTGNSLELRNISIHGGTMNPVTQATDGKGHPAYFTCVDDALITYDFFTINDVTSPIDGKTVVHINNPEWLQYLYYTIESVIFCDKDLGYLNIGNIAVPSSYLYMAAHGGMSWESGFKIDIDEIDYIYSGAFTYASADEESIFNPHTEQFIFTGPSNTLAAEYNALTFSGIHLAQIFTGVSDDPRYPATWVFSGNFTIGDLFNTVASNPAALDVLTVNDPTSSLNGKTISLVDLPMSGVFRVADVELGGTDFGPCAIDGIDIHKLQVQFVP